MKTGFNAFTLSVQLKNVINTKKSENNKMQLYVPLPFWHQHNKCILKAETQ